MKQLLLLLPLLLFPQPGHSRTTTLFCETSVSKVTGPDPPYEKVLKREVQSGGLNHEIIIDSLRNSAFVGFYKKGKRENLRLERASILITDDSYLLNRTREGREEKERIETGDGTWEGTKVHIKIKIWHATVEDWAVNRVNGDLIFLREYDWSWHPNKTENDKYTVNYQGKCTKKKPEKTLF